jgi:hypothetical protein
MIKADGRENGRHAYASVNHMYRLVGLDSLDWMCMRSGTEVTYDKENDPVAWRTAVVSFGLVRFMLLATTLCCQVKHEQGQRLGARWGA